MTGHARLNLTAEFPDSVLLESLIKSPVEEELVIEYLQKDCFQMKMKSCLNSWKDSIVEKQLLHRILGKFS